MKKVVENSVNTDVKLLTKTFRFLDAHYVRLLYEYCEYEPERAYRILEMIKQDVIPAMFMKKLIDDPNNSDTILSEKQKQYFKKYGHTQIDIFDTKNKFDDEAIKQNMLVEKSGFDFFASLPDDICVSIISFLDPFTFSKVAQTNKTWWELSHSESLDFYFKNLCMKIFKGQPTLPQTCRFGEVRWYVQTHPKQYGPNITNAVNNNLRYYVWKSEPESFKIGTAYFKSFGSYRNLFLQGPRIHFNGFYVCRHKYVKVGEKGFTHAYTPIHVVYYYRYIRFFEDGSLLCCVSSSKIKKEGLSKLLSRENLLNFDPNNKQELKIGEYMQFKNTLFVRIVKQNTIFSYEMQIESSESRICDKLQVLSYTLEMVDERQIVQHLYENKPYREKIIFDYLRTDLIEEDNGALERATSL